MVAESVTSRQNELRSFSAVNIQGHQRGGFCIVSVIRLIVVYVDAKFCLRQGRNRLKSSKRVRQDSHFFKEGIFFSVERQVPCASIQ